MTGAAVERDIVPDALASVYLHPGKLFASATPCTITTVLGSCVSVCLFDPVTGVGGANHYLLPQGNGSGRDALRFGATAIEALLESTLRLGARRPTLIAKLFGGANVLQAMQHRPSHLGTANVEVARAVLSAQGIPVRAEDVGGTRGRKLHFVVSDGTAWVKEL